MLAGLAHDLCDGAPLVLPPPFNHRAGRTLHSCGAAQPFELRHPRGMRGEERREGKMEGRGQRWKGRSRQRRTALTEGGSEKKREREREREEEERGGSAGRSLSLRQVGVWRDAFEGAVVKTSREGQKRKQAAEKENWKTHWYSYSYSYS
eukprot:scaffold102144_cov24-Tisochrysis_lutea.AAC.1